MPDSSLPTSTSLVGWSVPVALTVTISRSVVAFSVRYLTVPSLPPANGRHRTTMRMTSAPAAIASWRLRRATATRSLSMRAATSPGRFDSAMRLIQAQAARNRNSECDRTASFPQRRLLPYGAGLWLAGRILFGAAFDLSVCPAVVRCVRLFPARPLFVGGPGGRRKLLQRTLHALLIDETAPLGDLRERPVFMQLPDTHAAQYDALFGGKRRKQKEILHAFGFLVRKDQPGATRDHGQPVSRAPVPVGTRALAVHRTRQAAVTVK